MGNRIAERAGAWLRSGAALLLAVAAAPPFAAASEPVRRLDGFIAEAWTTERGLPQNSVTALAQTAEGYLWIATFGGLARFDGSRFRIFDPGSEPELPSSRISALMVDRRGRLWVGTEDAGVVVLSGDRFARPAGPRLGRSTVWAFAETADEAIWVATSDGIERWREGSVDYFGEGDGLPGSWVRTLEVTADGTLWAGTLGGAARFVAGRFEPALEVPVWAFATAADGWLLAVGEKGVSVVTGPRAGKLEVPAVLRAALRDRQGALWLGGERLGRVPVDESGCDFDDRQEFGRRIRTIFEDRDGGLWVGTDTHGLYELHMRRARSFSYGERLADGSLAAEASALPVFEDGTGNLWVGTCAGLQRFDGERLLPPPEQPEALMRCVSALAPAADGGLWIGARSVRKLGGAPAPRGFAERVGDRLVHALLERADGSLWIASNRGVHREYGGRLEPVPGLEGVEGWVLTELEGDRVGIGLRGEVAIVEAATVRRFAVTGPGARHVQVRDLWAAPDGALWAATYGAGLARIDSDGTVQRFDRSHGLAENFVSRILNDGVGHLWLSGNRGVYRVALVELAAAAAGSGRVVPLALGVADGLEVAETNGGGHPAGWLRRNGNLVFPTVRGIAVIDATATRKEAESQTVVLGRVLVDGREMSHAGLIRVPADGDRRLEIDFSAPTFVRPELVRFRYRLSPFDRDWRIDAGARRASYSRLPPGSYRFEVQAAGEDGRFAAAGALAEVEVAARLIETRTFRALVALILLTAAILYLRWRLGRAHQREEELRRQVAERTRELASVNQNLTRLVHDQTLEIRETRDVAILTLARLAELRDGTTGEHLERISRFSRRLALSLHAKSSPSIDWEFIEELTRSSPLHDIGKVAIPDAVLRKPGPLAAHERELMKTHTSVGSETLRAIGGGSGGGSFLAMAAEIAESHHERWDGGGYPRGLRGPEIPLPARIVAIVDAYDAITSERPYKAAIGHDEALRRIACDRGNHFDPELVDAFLEIQFEIDDIRRTSTAGR